MTLRPYQQTILDSVRRGWQEFNRQLVVAPTGSGKTVIFSCLAHESSMQGERTLILVDQEELVWQALDKLKRATGLIGQAEKAEHCASPTAPVVVATVQSMIRRLEKWPADHFGLVVADEADKSISASWQTVLSHFDPHARVFGCTASPNRTDRKNLGCYYQNVAAEVGLFDLIREGYLSPIAVKMLPIQIDLSAVHLKNGDFDTGELDAVIGPHLKAVAEAIQEHALFRKTLVFLPLIRTSEKFIEICRGLGLAAEHIDGTSEDRAEKLGRFASWDFDVLANSALLTRGYDDPGIDCVVMLRPTKSVTLYTQCIGRGTRISPGKQNLLLLDFLFQTTRHSLCRPANLIAKDDFEAEQITKLAQESSQNALPGEVALQIPLDLQKLASEAVATREEALRKRLEEQRKKSGVTISSEEFCLRCGKFEVAEYQETMEWESQPATEKQQHWLKKAKIDLGTVRSKGHAAKLLDLYFTRKPPTLASPGQRALMRRMGHPSAENATADEARRFFADLRKPKQTEMAV